MREILFCDNCGKTWTGDKKKDLYCSSCYGVLRALNISDNLWTSMSEKEKLEILNNSDNTVNKKIQLEIIDGNLADRKAYFDIENHIFEIENYSLYNEGNILPENMVTCKSFTEVVSFSKEIIEKDNSKTVTITVGIIAWLGLGIYELLRTGDSFSFIESIFSGLIWAGIALLISKQFKKRIEVINIRFLDLEIVINYEPTIFSILDNKQKINMIHSHSNEDKYDQLIKLKDLLDKNILTEEEFNIEKKKILER